MIEIRGIRFQTIWSASGHRTQAIIAMRPDAIAPTFIAAPGCPLLYQEGLEISIKDVFGNEEGQVLADELATTTDTIWRCRKALGLAEQYTGESQTTKWRRRRRSAIII